MAYSDFSLRDVLEQFQLTLADDPDLFGPAPEVQPSPFLTTLLQEFLPLALAINTEKARSEFAIAPLLADLRAQLGHRISVFSGIDFTVDAARGLAGPCDFILSRAPEQQFLRRPVAAGAFAAPERARGSRATCAAITRLRSPCLARRRPARRRREADAGSGRTRAAVNV